MNEELAKCRSTSLSDLGLHVEEGHRAVPAYDVHVPVGDPAGGESAYSGVRDQVFTVQYSDADHHIFKEEINTTITGVSGPSVNMEVFFLLRDSSGDIDDAYQGYVTVMAIVDRV